MDKIKKYRAVFFDWDGTAVLSRLASTDKIVLLIEKLLLQGIKLMVISGTTYNNIANGQLHELIKPSALEGLFLGLGRGAYNYGFQNGQPVMLSEKLLTIKEKAILHRVCYKIHQHLLTKYGIETDIVFSRPNYCKIDLMVGLDRGENLFLQANEIEMVNKLLETKGYKDGLLGLMKLAEHFGDTEGIKLQATTDAKYLEVGPTTKSDNINYFMQAEVLCNGIAPSECCFFGDEFANLGEGICGSDAYMVTPFSKGGDFFDVSPQQRSLPEGVKYIGGGVESFENFLGEQISL